MSRFMRSFALEDIQIRAGGDGRTVEAYAAVFDTPTEIQDQQGHYREQIDRAAFNKTIADRGARFPVFYNHAMTLHGRSSDLGSVPIGAAVEPPRVDSRGLITVSRYNKSQLADSVLEAIRNGDIRSQSFSGRFLRSTPPPSRSGYRAAPNGDLTLVTRTEIAMSEYGPTPIPAYDVPMVLDLRSAPARAGQLRRVRDHFAGRATLTAEDTNRLTSLLALLAAADASVDPIVEALCSADLALDAAQLVVSSMLAVPDPDVDDADDAMTDTTPAMASGRRPGTGTGPAAAEEPPAAVPAPVHSGRIPPAQRARMAAIVRGI